MQVVDLEKFLLSVPLEQKKLDLSSSQITSLPSSIERLVNLEELILSRNGLTTLPDLRKLERLRLIDLSYNSYDEFPESLLSVSQLKCLRFSSNDLEFVPELNNLLQLEELDLSENNISNFEFSSLVNLRSIDVSGNVIEALPNDLGRLQNLIELRVSKNKLEALPNSLWKLEKLKVLLVAVNDLGALPNMFKELKALQILDISQTMIDRIPGLQELQELRELYVKNGYAELLFSDLCKPIGLKKLVLTDCKLDQLPAGIEYLEKLECLVIDHNLIKSLPDNIDRLSVLSELYASQNRLTVLPESLTRLTALRKLNLAENRLQVLPSGMNNLSSLEELSLAFNDLKELPNSIGQLKRLWLLLLTGNNKLIYPSPEIVQQGIDAVKVFLNSSPKGGTQRWSSKLLVVGEGGVGKSCTIRSLRREPFENQDTTHGIDLSTIELLHPDGKGTMELNTWDFGGQEIYHATHQFFLTDKSLFLLVWNARHGFEAGKLHYWLKTIAANAPESPIIVLATHSDQRMAEIPKRSLKEEFPQIDCFCDVSNSTGDGVEDLVKRISQVASELPHMGQLWPTAWLKAADLVKARPEKYTYAVSLKKLMKAAGLEESEITVLAQWLHELGEILYFQNSSLLKDLVILKPRWVSEYISRVLDSEQVAKFNGVLTRDTMEVLWADLEPHLQNHFLNLMESFDLSYRIFEDQDMSLVVERLPLESPDLQLWENICARSDTQKISMKFVLSDILPGIPTWFIARQHRFSIGHHWRRGVLFADGAERKHLGLVRLERDPQTNGYFLELSVAGLVPITFFSLLRDGIELTLNRYPGLRVTSFLPCPDPLKNGCVGQFEYDSLIRALGIVNKHSAQCHSCWSDIPINSLLFGLHSITQEDVLKKLEELQKTTNEGFIALNELTQRNFVVDLRRQQSEIESICPSVFVLLPDERSPFTKDIDLERVNLQLYCEAPGQWHSTDYSGRYYIDKPRAWFKAVAPYLKALGSVIKYSAPLVKPLIGLQAPAVLTTQRSSEFELMEQIVATLPDWEELVETKLETKQDPLARQYFGASLRALYNFLDEKDEAHIWGGLQKILTPEGNYLWLCSEHAKLYTDKHERLWSAKTGAGNGSIAPGSLA